MGRNQLTSSFFISKALLISVRNTPPAIQHLMSHVNAQFLLVGKDLLPQLQDIVNGPFRVAPLDIMANAPDSQEIEDGLLGWDDIIPVDKDSSPDDYPEEMGRYFTYLHTSGSTGNAPSSLSFRMYSELVVVGHPKPIGWTHENIYTACVSVGKDRKSRIGRVFYTPMPLFHVCDVMHCAHECA